VNLNYFITNCFIYVFGKLNIFLVFKKEYGLLNNLSIKVNLLQSTTTELLFW
jgi:hypothetical protein